MKSLDKSLYETPQTEVMELTTSNIICASGGGGNDDYNEGGEM